MVPAEVVASRYGVERTAAGGASSPSSGCRLPGGADAGRGRRRRQTASADQGEGNARATRVKPQSMPSLGPEPPGLNGMSGDPDRLASVTKV